MSQVNVHCVLEYSNVCDLSECLSEAIQNHFKYVAFPITHPRFRRHHHLGQTAVHQFTRSDLLLASNDWNYVVAKTSPYLDVDSPCPIVRKRHEDCMIEELSYCRGLGVLAIIVNLRSRKSANLAKIVLQHYLNSHAYVSLWVRVPMMISIKDAPDDSDEPWEEPWHWWSEFHQLLEWNKKVGVMLEVSGDLPPPHILQRWLGEPVKNVVFGTSLFHSNKKGYPVLSRPHQVILQDFLNQGASLSLTGATKGYMQHYAQYFQFLWDKVSSQKDPMKSYANGYEDTLQNPLQPLADNLDTDTYSVFETDPIKYDQYQKALVLAFKELQRRDTKKIEGCHKETSAKINSIDNGIDNQGGDEPTKTSGTTSEDKSAPFIVMVLGAGRGPLVRAVLNAADITDTKVKVHVVEKNPGAVVTLLAQLRTVWAARAVEVHAGDMRRLALPHPAHLIVSELLGSWSDNELSPECLDGAMRLLRPDGVCVPAAYTSYAAPLSSAKLWAAAHSKPLAPSQHSPAEVSNLETIYVVYFRNKFIIAEPKPVFTFAHPSKGCVDNEGQEMRTHDGLPQPDNRRMTELSWAASADSVVHGFAGYFDSELFGAEMISILPATHSDGMISWFPMFIPLRTPLRVRKGEIIKATFWRCVDLRRVWYEWVASVGDYTTPLHNPNGRSYEMLL